MNGNGLILPSKAGVQTSLEKVYFSPKETVKLAGLSSLVYSLAYSHWELMYSFWACRKQIFKMELRAGDQQPVVWVCRKDKTPSGCRGNLGANEVDMPLGT